MGNAPRVERRVATVYPLVCSGRSADAANDTPADTQDLYGITPGGPDSSSAETAQPVHAVRDAAVASGGNSTHAVEGDCDLLVTEHLAHDLRVGPGLQLQGGERVVQVVEANRPAGRPDAAGP